MKETSAHLARALREAAENAARRPLLPLASLGTLSLCLLLAGLFALAAWNLDRLAQSWSGGGEMTVYLDDDVTSQRSSQIADAVRHLPGVTGATLVAPKEARAKLQSALGARGELLDGVDDTFLPASIEVKLQPGVASLLRAHPGFQRLSTAAGVEEVDLHADTTERLDVARTLVRRGAIAIAIIVALATLYLVGATIRLGVEARRDTLAVIRLVGGTEAFVRAPFLVEGLVTGALGAALAAMALWLLFQNVAPRVTSALGSWLAAAPLSFFSPSTIAYGIVGGALLGLLGASAAFSREARA